MATEPPKEHLSAYFVQDRDNLEEMARLEVQDKLLTRGLGGVLPELADPSHLRCVLDVGCGTGGWLIETAQTYPMIEKLVGVDISGKMLDYARAQAETQLLCPRPIDQRMHPALHILQAMHRQKTHQFPGYPIMIIRITIVRHRMLF